MNRAIDRTLRLFHGGSRKIQRKEIPAAPRECSPRSYCEKPAARWLARSLFVAAAICLAGCD